MCTEKHILVKKKNVYKWAKNGFATTSLNKTMEWKHTLSDKEKIPGVAVNLKGHADSLLGYEKTHHYKQDFLLPTH